MRTEKRRIVLLGATGYTGQRVLRELLARGEEPTLVGRSRSKMLALAGGFQADLPVVEVDVTSTADMTRVLDSNDVVLSTVGPFMQLGIATITAAAQAGARRPGSPGVLIDERAGKRVRAFHYAGVRRSAMTVGGSEHLGLPEAFPHLDSIDVYLGWLGRATRPTQIIAALNAPLLRWSKARATITRLSQRLPGSEREPDSDGRSLVIAVARDASGAPLATTALTGPDPYEMTASLMAWGATHAAAPDAALMPGVHGPVAPSASTLSGMAPLSQACTRSPAHRRRSK